MIFDKHFTWYACHAVLFHTFRCTEDLTKSIFVDANSDQNGYILNLTIPAALEVNAVDVNVWVFAR